MRLVDAPMLSATAMRRIAEVRAGARVVRLTDGWIGIEPAGGPMAQVSPRCWAAMRERAPDLPCSEAMAREASDGFCERMLKPGPIMRRPGMPPENARARARRA